jgi:hypothetical protein
MEYLENVSAFMTALAPVVGVFVPFVLSLAVLTAFVAIAIIGIVLWRK